MKRLIGKLWNSPTFTQWLNLLTKPLRLFLLTPLILTAFPQEEIDVFYVLASVGAFAGLAATLLPDVFYPVLGYFFGGARKLDHVGEQGRKEENPNWEGFGDAFATLGRIQLRLLVPLVILIALILYGSLTRKLGGEVATTYWVAAGLLMVRSVFDLLVGRFGATLRSIGLVALINRVNVGYSAASVLFASLSIFLGGGLVAVVATQLVCSSVQRMHIARIARRRIPGLGRGHYSREVYLHVRRPFYRASTGVLCSAGVERLMPALLAGSLVGGTTFASYALALNLALTVLTASRGMLASQMPAYIKLYTQGDLKMLEKRGTHRVGLSAVVFLVAFITIGPFFAWYLQLAGSKVEFISMGLWALLGLLLLLKHLSLSFAMLYNVTNERPFYLRVIAGGLGQLAILIGLWMTGAQISLGNAVLITVLPQVLALNWAPLSKFSVLTSKSVRTIVADMLGSMRPDRVAHHVHQRFSDKKRVGPAN